MGKNLMEYVPKKKQGAIKVIEKSYDGYEVVLNDGWLLDGNNSMFISYTVAELRNDLKNVEYDLERWEQLFPAKEEPAKEAETEGVKYALKLVITEEKQSMAFRFGAKWYVMKQEYCPLHTCINNTQDLSKAVKFDTIEEAKEYRAFWFVEGSYKIVKLTKKTGGR